MKEAAKPGVMYTSTVPGAADALALLAGLEQVNSSVVGHQVGEEGGTTLIDVLWRAVLKSLEGSMW